MNEAEDGIQEGEEIGIPGKWSNDQRQGHQNERPTNRSCELLHQISFSYNLNNRLTKISFNLPKVVVVRFNPKFP